MKQLIQHNKNNQPNILHSDMNNLNITIKDIVGMLTIVVGVTGGWFAIKGQVSENEENLFDQKIKVELLEQKLHQQELIVTELTVDVKHIKNQTQAIYDRIVLGGTN